MGLLDIYENIITNPKPLTPDYFKTRPKVQGLSTWYSYDLATAMGELNICGYTTYKIPIIKILGNEPIQIASIKFTYDFDSKLLFYSIDKAKILSVYGRNIPVNTLILKKDSLKEIGQLLEVDMLDIKPGRTFKNIENIRDFELVIDGTKSILVDAGYYLPEF